MVVNNKINTPYQTIKSKQGKCKWWVAALPLSCWTRIYPVFANSADPNQWASEEANWSGSALFIISIWICWNNLDQEIWLAEN